jgi:hypothetical protein
MNSNQETQPNALDSWDIQERKSTRNTTACAQGSGGAKNTELDQPN